MKVISEIEVTYPCYGPLEDKLLRLFRSGAPDFALADTLVRLGADVNAVGTDDEENILSKILLGYWESQNSDCEIEDCEQDSCEGCPCNINKNPNLGESMLSVIRWFLDQGFDVTKKEQRYGAQCLYSLTLSTFDAHIITATKMLLDAGAKNISISTEDDTATPWNWIAAEGSCQDTIYHNHSLGNIYEAVYQIYQAIEDGRPFAGIDSYEKAVGKRIQRILAQKPENGPVFFDLDLPEFQHPNCFTRTLYFLYDGGVLITTQYADFWTDTILPVGETVDVSEAFPGIVGSVLQSFSFDHNEIAQGASHFEQPATTIEMDSGHKVTFSTNIGEVGPENRAAYYSLS